MKLNCWKENVSLLKQLCRDEGIKCSAKKLHTDVEGDTLYEFKAKTPLSRKAQDYYDKHRVRK